MDGNDAVKTIVDVAVRLLALAVRLRDTDGLGVSVGGLVTEPVSVAEVAAVKLSELDWVALHGIDTDGDRDGGIVLVGVSRRLFVGVDWCVRLSVALRLSVKQSPRCGPTEAADHTQTSGGVGTSTGAGGRKQFHHNWT